MKDGYKQHFKTSSVYLGFSLMWLGVFYGNLYLVMGSVLLFVYAYERKTQLPHFISEASLGVMVFPYTNNLNLIWKLTLSISGGFGIVLMIVYMFYLVEVENST